ncbi:5925_t:CDS:1, partial [Acaulospora colombiana]
TLKGRRSLMGLFARGKEKDRRSESPPPVPSLPIRSGSTPATPVHPVTISSSPAISTPTTAVPSPHPDQTPQVRAPKRIPPPALNVVVTSPQSQQPQMHDLRPPPPISIPQKSATPPPSSSTRHAIPRKQSSASTLSPTTGLKPNSAPSTIQGFKGLSLRPMSTMFSSMPADYLSNSAANPPLPTAGYMSPSTSGHFSTQSPTTPSLWSSRSESISTGSSELPLHTPGLMHSLNSSSFTDGSGPNSPSTMQKQLHGAKEVYKHHIAELEAQVAALKAEVAELKQCPCPSCGFLGGGSSSGEKTSVVHRPRAKTAA